MANIITNLLKLTDYPFAYSLISLVLAMHGRGIDWDNAQVGTFVPLLTFIGLVATALAISDPFGNLIRLIIRTLGYHGYKFTFLRINDVLANFMDEIGFRYFFDRHCIVNKMDDSPS